MKRIEIEKRLHGLEASIFKQQASRTEVSPEAEVCLGEDHKRQRYFMQLRMRSKKDLLDLRSEPGG